MPVSSKIFELISTVNYIYIYIWLNLYIYDYLYDFWLHLDYRELVYNQPNNQSFSNKIRHLHTFYEIKAQGALKYIFRLIKIAHIMLALNIQLPHTFVKQVPWITLNYPKFLLCYELE